MSELEILNQIRMMERKLRRLESLKSTPADWRPIAEELTYASATTFTAASDVTDRNQVGDWVQWEQSSTVKYGRITTISYSFPNTTFTILGDAVANEAISNAFYSRLMNPSGLSKNVIRYTDYDESEQSTTSTSFVASTISVSVPLAVAGYIKATCTFQRKVSPGRNGQYMLRIGGTQATEKINASNTSYAFSTLRTVKRVVAGTYAVDLAYLIDADSAYIDDAYMVVEAIEE